MSSNLPGELAAAKSRAKTEQQFQRARREFLLGFERVFAEHPSVQSISWPQSSSYYDDNYTRFRAHTESFEINGIESWDATHSDDNALKSAAIDVDNLLHGLSPREYQHFFGGDVLITITREGITIEGWDGF